MKTSVYNQKAEVVGEIELNPKIFEVKSNSHLLAEAVRVQLSNSRQGSSNTKTRGEVSGGGKKPWKQKGTGRARVGSIRSPIWRHGGVTFGPRAKRNWTLKINKKAKRQALFMSLSDKAKDGKLIIIDQIVLEQPKTKEFVKLVGGFKKAVKDFGNQQLWLLPKADQKMVKASRNLQTVQSMLAGSLNVVDVLKADTVVALKDSLGVIEKTFLRNAKLKNQNAK